MNRQVYNPFLPLNEYIPDGEPHVWGDRVYHYGSHDKEGGYTFCMQDYTLYICSFVLDQVVNSARQSVHKLFHRFFKPHIVDILHAGHVHVLFEEPHDRPFGTWRQQCILCVFTYVYMEEIWYTIICSSRGKPKYRGCTKYTR